MSKVQEILSKLAGKAKAAKAALSGDAGILSTLQGEHTEINMLMKAIADDAYDDHDQDALETRRALYPKIKITLLAHSKAEEQELYAVLQMHPPTRENATHSIVEHKEIEHLLRRLDHLDVADLGWLPTFVSLQMKVEHHVRHEEEVLFEQAKTVFTKDQLRDIDNYYRSVRKRLQDALEGGFVEHGPIPTPFPHG
jgi:hypothetical protein